jgi:hypothetical protein
MNVVSACRDEWYDSVQYTTNASMITSATKAESERGTLLLSPIGINNTGKWFSNSFH